VDVAVTTGSGSASAHNAFTYLEAGSVGVPAGRAPSSGASGASGSPAPAPTSRWLWWKRGTCWSTRRRPQMHSRWKWAIVEAALPLAVHRLRL